MVSLLYDLMVAAGRTRQALAVQVTLFAALFPALYLGATHDGIRGVGWAQAAVSIFIVLPLSWWGVRGVGLRASDLARPVVRPLVAAAVLAGICLILLRAGLPDLVTLLLAAAIGGAVYLAITWPTWAGLLGEFRRNRGKNDPAHAG